MRKQKILKRIVAFFAALLILMSCIVSAIPVSAAEELIFIDYSVADKTNMFIYFDTDSNSQFAEFEPVIESSLYDCSYTVSTFSALESTNENGLFPGIGSLSYFLTLDSSSYSALDLSKYALTVEWRVAPINEDTRVSITTDDMLDLRDHVTEIKSFYTSGVSVFGKSDIAAYSNSSGVYSIGSNYTSGSYTFPSSMTSSLLSKTSVSLSVPAKISTSAEVYTRIYLTPVVSDSTTVPDETTDPDAPEISEPTGSGTFIDPIVYPYDFYFRINDTKGEILPSAKVTITDVYHDGTGYKFRNYNKYYTVGTQPLMQNVYDTLISMVRDTSDEEAFLDSVCEVFSVTFPCTDTEVADVSLYGFRMEWYFNSPSDWVFSNYKNNIETLNTSFVGFEPFSVKIGNVTIPYDYFVYTYLPSSNTFKVSLDLDGKNDAHRMFMNAFLNAEDVTLTYTLDYNLVDGVLLGITRSGFYKKYEAEGTPIVPDESTGGFSQEDIDNAYNKGYLQGTADNGDKNYVFGFVNGLWRGFNDFYKIVTNGISIGGITLSAIITSVVVIVVLFFVVKKVL